MPLDLHRQPHLPRTAGCRLCGEPVTVYIRLRATRAHLKGKAGSTVGSASGPFCATHAVAVFDAAEAIILATEPRE
jgi:hypothetical protein